MEFVVQRLRSRGRRLLLSEREVGQRGELTVSIDPPKRNGGVSRRAANLTVYEGPAQPRRSVWSPLFDPRIVTLDLEVLILAGIEINFDSESGDIFETVQIWSCIRYSGEPRPPPPGRKSWAAALEPKPVWMPPKSDVV